MSIQRVVKKVNQFFTRSVLLICTVLHTIWYCICIFGYFCVSVAEDSDTSSFVHKHIVCARFSGTTHKFSSMDAQGIQARVRRIIEISFEEPALKDRLIHSLDLLERELSEPIERRKVHLKKSQLVILKKIVVALGKKSEEVDKYITQKINENRVQTNENGEITVLDLSMSQFSGSIPPEIGELTALTVLNLNSNQLSGSIPPEIGQLKALTELRLFDNELSGSIPSEIGRLKVLTKLGLGNNKLSGYIPPEIGQLKVLTELWLTRNLLSGSIPPEIGQLKALTGLSLAVNQLSGSLPPEIGQMKALEKIYLFKNKLSGSIPSELGELRSLLFLRLSDNEELGGELPVFSPECRVDVSDTRILSTDGLYAK